VSNSPSLIGLLLDALDSIEPVSSSNQAGSTRSVGAGLLANAWCHSLPWWLNALVRQQAGSYECVVSNIPILIGLLLNRLDSTEPVSSSNQAGSAGSVGAGLLANAWCHSPPWWLSGPVRQQAGSYGCVSNISTLMAA
jgi:hypothetical protein